MLYYLCVFFNKKGVGDSGDDDAMVVLYRVAKNKITHVWVAPDTAKLSDASVSKDVLLVSDIWQEVYTKCDIYIERERRSETLFVGNTFPEMLFNMTGISRVVTHQYKRKD